MIDNERNPSSSYRVEVISGNPFWYRITTYPQRLTNSQVVQQGNSGYYRADLVPKWIITAITMLDMASENGVGSIQHFGSKAGDTYWLMSDQVYGKSKDAKT